MKMRLGFFLLLLGGQVYAETSPTDLPLLSSADFQYEGAFRVPADDFGNSSMNFSVGAIEYNPAHHSVFLIGHSYQQAVAEFSVPALVKSSVLGSLNMAAAPLQGFTDLIGRVPGGNPQELNQIGGIKLYSAGVNPLLIVNVYEYYDAPGDNTQTTLVLENANSIASSAVRGFYVFAGGAGHTSGWMSPIPSQWQSLLGGIYLTGQSSGIPIISRLSVGPSAFSFNPSSFQVAGAVPNPVPTVQLLDFSLDHPLHTDLGNDSLNNKLWTHLSRVTYGYIPPGTRTYVTLGVSGGHESGVCYKCTQDNGNLCGGYCSYRAADNHPYYWLWDVRDLLAVKQGTKQAYEVRPYEYGVFNSAFPQSDIGGGAFDPDSGLLYLTALKADYEQGTYANPPVIMAYRISSGPRQISPPQRLRLPQ